MGLRIGMLRPSGRATAVAHAGGGVKTVVRGPRFIGACPVIAVVAMLLSVRDYILSILEKGCFVSQKSFVDSWGQSENELEMQVGPWSTVISRVVCHPSLFPLHDCRISHTKKEMADRFLGRTCYRLSYPHEAHQGQSDKEMTFRFPGCRNAGRFRVVAPKDLHSCFGCTIPPVITVLPCSRERIAGD